MGKVVLVLLFTLTLVLLIGSAYTAQDTMDTVKEEASKAGEAVKDAAESTKEKAKEVPGKVKNTYDDVTGSNAPSSASGSAAGSGSAQGTDQFSWNWFKSKFGFGGSAKSGAKSAPAPGA
ncbi:hypothetical protein ACHQM5_015507 [Ranunculus cassubicifolius]